jgi:Protein of unknown function (DUF3300)
MKWGFLIRSKAGAARLRVNGAGVWASKIIRAVHRGDVSKSLRNDALKMCSIFVSISLVLPPPSAFSQTAAPAPASAPAVDFNPEQLDALLAPIALYPDTLLVQVLIASTFPLEIVDASRWLAKDNNKAITGDDLAKALEPLTWDPSVKSLVPFPQVLAQMNENLDWTQQLGYAFATQQADTMDSVQRLRQQAREAGTLKTTEQQVVSTQAVLDDQGAPTPQQTIVIQPADPQVIYVPAYNPTQVYGTWPYPATPPVYLPPPGYAIGTALVTGMAFAAGAAVVGSLWGWATPGWGWGRGHVNVNVSRYNHITTNNVHRANFSGNQWRPPAQGVGGRPMRPPGGPVGVPSRANGLPANAIGRPSVKVPADGVNRPNIGSGGNRTNIGQVNIGSGNSANRANIGSGNTVNRPSPGNAGAVNRPNTGTVNRPAAASNRPAAPSNFAANRPTSAFSGVSDGARAGQFQARGSQSRAIQQPRGGGARAQNQGATRRQR